MTLQDIADRLIADLIPQIGQRPRNPVIAPVTVLLGHANDQLLDLSANPRPARASVRALGHGQLAALFAKAKVISKLAFADLVQQRAGTAHLFCFAARLTLPRADLTQLRPPEPLPPVGLELCFCGLKRRRAAICAHAGRVGENAEQ